MNKDEVSNKILNTTIKDASLNFYMLQQGTLNNFRKQGVSEENIQIIEDINRTLFELGKAVVISVISNAPIDVQIKKFETEKN